MLRTIQLIPPSLLLQHLGRKGGYGRSVLNGFGQRQGLFDQFGPGVRETNTYVPLASDDPCLRERRDLRLRSGEQSSERLRSPNLPKELSDRGKISIHIETHEGDRRSAANRVVELLHVQQLRDARTAPSGPLLHDEYLAADVALRPSKPVEIEPTER